MPRNPIRNVVVAAAVCALAGPGALASGRDGKAIVDEVCVVCHGTGKDGAPRIGDANAWKPRAERGLTALTRSALDGVRRMPPHGGKLALDDTDLKRAIAYMVNRSGGKWIEPIDRTRPAQMRTGAQVIGARCSTCHENGLDGAPRYGDKLAWRERASRGVDSLVRSAIHGHGAMPARGGMADLTDGELRSAVELLVTSGLKGEAPPRP